MLLMEGPTPYINTWSITACTLYKTIAQFHMVKWYSSYSYHVLNITMCVLMCFVVIMSHCNIDMCKSSSQKN